MQILFQIVLILGVVKYCCKAGFFENRKAIIAYSLFAGLVAIVFYPFIIKMNTNTFDMLLSDKKMVSNIAVIITIEAISGMLISIGMLHNLFEKKKRQWVRILKLTPGVIIFGVIFYVELLLFKTIIGVGFIWISILTTFLFIFGLAGISTAIKYIFPEKSIRYELKFLVNILLFVIAVLMNAFLAGYNKSNYESNVDYTKLLVFTGIVAIGFVLGLLLYRNKGFFRRILKNK